MKNANATLILIFVCLTLGMLLPSCASKGERNTGIRADADAVSSVREEIENKKNSLLAAEGDVFWTESGTLWHSTYTCSYIRNSKNIMHGSTDEALLAGKTGACSRCAAASADGEEIWKTLEEREAQTGDVFFVRDGSCYHRTRECAELDGESAICSGNLALARTLGFSDECPICSQND